MEFKEYLKESIKVLEKSGFEKEIKEIIESIKDCLEKGGKILVCGNGGSFADAQHFTAELVGKFEKERKAIPAVCLGTNLSTLTSISNDTEFSQIYSKEIEAIGKEKDILIAITTSGNSENVIEALKKAKEKKMKSIGLLGNKGGKAASLCDKKIVVDSNRTCLIQQVHEILLHFIALKLEESVWEK